MREPVTPAANMTRQSCVEQPQLTTTLPRELTQGFMQRRNATLRSLEENTGGLFFLPLLRCIIDSGLILSPKIISFLLCLELWLAGDKSRKGSVDVRAQGIISLINARMDMYTTSRYFGGTLAGMQVWCFFNIHPAGNRARCKTLCFRGLCRLT